MKKLLSILGAVGLVATSASTVVSCGSGDIVSKIDGKSIDAGSQKTIGDFLDALELSDSDAKALTNMSLEGETVKGLDDSELMGVAIVNSSDSSYDKYDYASLLSGTPDSITKNISDKGIIGEDGLDTNVVQIVSDLQTSLDVSTGLYNDKPDFYKMFNPETWKAVYIFETAKKADLSDAKVETAVVDINYTPTPTE